MAWTLDGGPPVWMGRSEAVALLRHQTMLVYLLLAGLEGIYLIIRWGRGRRGDIALRMLTRRHWFIFLFRVGWVALFAGINLGFVYHAMAGRSPSRFSFPVPRPLRIGNPHRHANQADPAISSDRVLSQRIDAEVTVVVFSRYRTAVAVTCTRDLSPRPRR